MQTPPDNQFYSNITLAAESQLLRPLIHFQLMPGVPENNKENTRRWIKLKHFIRSQQVKSWANYKLKNAIVSLSLNWSQ